MTFSTKFIHSDRVIGLAGAGTMGRCMLDSLNTAGYPVMVYDPSPAAQEYARDKGAVLAANPAELAEEADIIFLSLPKPQHVCQVVSGKDGLTATLTEGQIIVDTSTVDPDTSKRNARIVEERGAHYIDAPILGRPCAVGNWLMPAGGEADQIDYLEPVFHCFAKKAVHVGGHGAGNAFKLLNQLMFSVINGISAEVMTLAGILGLDKKVFFDVISQSGAATVSGLFKETGARIAEDRYGSPTFTVELLCKDAGLGIEMAKSAGVTPLIAGFVQTLNENAKGKGYADKDTSVLADVFEQFYSKINM